jgi:hypothetical protein
MKPADEARILGVHRSTVTRWRKKGERPRYATLAIQAHQATMWHSSPPTVAGGSYHWARETNSQPIVVFIKGDSATTVGYGNVRSVKTMIDQGWLFSGVLPKP